MRNTILRILSQKVMETIKQLEKILVDKDEFKYYIN